MHLDVRDLVHSAHWVIVKIALLYDAVFDGYLTHQRGTHAFDDPALNLVLGASRVNDQSTIDGSNDIEQRLP